MADNTNFYNKKSVYENRIEPIVRDLKVMCMAEDLPMFVSVAVKNDENGTDYINNTVMSGTGIRLTDNRIAKLLLYINDFDAVLPPEVEAAARTIESYINEVREAAGNDAASKHLSDDRISDYCSIAGGGNHIRIC